MALNHTKYWSNVIHNDNSRALMKATPIHRWFVYFFYDPCWKYILWISLIVYVHIVSHNTSMMQMQYQEEVWFLGVIKEGVEWNAPVMCHRIMILKSQRILDWSNNKHCQYFINIPPHTLKVSQLTWIIRDVIEKFLGTNF